MKPEAVAALKSEVRKQFDTWQKDPNTTELWLEQDQQANEVVGDFVGNALDGTTYVSELAVGPFGEHESEILNLLDNLVEAFVRTEFSSPENADEFAGLELGFQFQAWAEFAADAVVETDDEDDNDDDDGYEADDDDDDDGYMLCVTLPHRASTKPPGEAA